MQGMLAFQNAPPFAAPLRFFLTAPLFSLAAGLLLLAAGPGVSLVIRAEGDDEAEAVAAAAALFERRFDEDS